MFKIWIAFIILLVAVFNESTVQSKPENALGKSSENHNTVFVSISKSTKKQQESDEIGLKFMRDVFFQLARNPNDKNIAIVKTLLKILIAQKQSEERMNNYWNLRQG
jgi:hypothetical protein